MLEYCGNSPVVFIIGRTPISVYVNKVIPGPPPPNHLATSITVIVQGAICETNTVKWNYNNTILNVLHCFSVLFQFYFG